MTVGHRYYYTMDGSIPNKNSSKYIGKTDIERGISSFSNTNLFI
ncbi:hypothetical protein TPHSE_05880 [Terrisporobacter petrolearius]